MNKNLKRAQKPIVETMINTSALALTSYGVVQITTGSPYGYIAVAFGMGLEFLKYWARKEKFFK